MLSRAEKKKVATQTDGAAGARGAGIDEDGVAVNDDETGTVGGGDCNSVEMAMRTAAVSEAAMAAAMAMRTAAAAEAAMAAAEAAAAGDGSGSSGSGGSSGGGGGSSGGGGGLVGPNARQRMHELSNRFYSLIPHNFGMDRPRRVATLEAVQGRRERARFFCRARELAACDTLAST